MKPTILLIAIFLFTTLSCKKKDNSQKNSSCTEGLEVGKHFLCNGDSISNGILIQVNNQSNKIGIQSVINGNNYDNVVWAYNLPDSLKIIGKKIYFNYKTPTGSEIITSPPCNTQYPGLPNYPQIYITNVSSIKCL